MELKPSQTLAILLVFLLIGIPAAWFTQKGFQPTGPGDLALDAEGNLYAHYYDQVIVIDASDHSARSYELEKIGAVGLWGGISFFPNGDWLIAPEGTVADGQLHRCTDTGSLDCLPLEGMDRRFHRTFRTAVANASHFYLSDSARDALTLHDSGGQELDQADGKLGLPAEVRVYNDLLAIADGAGFRMQLIDLEPVTGKFLGPARSFATTSPNILDAHIKQPLDFFLHADTWYVLVKDPIAMTLASLRRFDGDGNYIDEIPLPDNRMIMAMEKVDDSIVLSDFRLGRLLRIGLDGQPMPDLTSPEWEAQRDRLEGTGQLKLSLGIGLWTVFALLLLAGFVVAIRKSKEQGSPDAGADEIGAGPELKSPTSIHDPRINWLGHNRSLQLIPILLILMVLGSLAVVPLLGQDCSARTIAKVIYAMVAGMAVLSLALILFSRRLMQTRLGVLSDWLTVSFPDGSTAQARAADLRLFRQTVLYVGDRKVHLGPPNSRFFKKLDFDTLLQPLLSRAQSLSGTSGYKWRWQRDRGAVLTEFIVTALALLALLYMFTAGEEATRRQMDKLYAECQSPGGESGTDHDYERI
jgi:hypothetical protein